MTDTQTLDAPETLPFGAEVGRLLDIVAHALYSDRDVFLRELISNASDACDRLRYAALTEPDLLAGDPQLAVRLIPDTDAKTLTVADNGIGMNRDELVGNLGTIARSGTSAFLEQLGEGRKDLSLIGQFGVGFYAAFMVATKVEVLSRKAGEAQAWRWVSDGKGSFTVTPAEKPGRGTEIVLHLRDDAHEYLEEPRLKRIVETYSDHVPIPVRFGAGDDAPTLNRAGALWLRPKSEITEEQYREFYHHVAHAFDDPWATLHWRAEGVIEYAALLFVPTQKPFDLFDPQRAHRVRLYVKRVFITDQAEGLVPPYLRFLRGLVDSEDLPLNVSREVLQANPVVAKIRAGLTKRVLSELAKRAEANDDYARFWETFGAVLKEGLYEDYENREQLLKLARFRSTASEGWVSLADYVGRMRPGQDAIFVINGDSVEAARKSPQLEGFRARGIEVLILTDPVDEFWVAVVDAFEGKPFKSVTRAGDELAKVEPVDETARPEPAADREVATLIALLKTVLGDAVKDVKSSARLTDSAVCLVADAGDPDIHLERMLKAHGRLDTLSRRVLEINPGHPLIKAMAAKASAGGHSEVLGEAAWLLLDQARILDGEPVADPQAFARRLSEALKAGLAG